jgi:hypothetical protein
MNTSRPAAVAGSFYPDDADELRRVLVAHLEAAEASPGPGAAAAGHAPKIIVVPHAGYVYSGDVAALAYAPLARWRGHITRVVLLGPVHRVPVLGLAAPTVAAFDTPLGRVPLDRAALATLQGLRQVVWSDAPHAHEHALEVQLPFLQAVLGEGFALVPLAVGQASAAEVAEVLERLWGGDETLVVISSDLSHYLPYAQAQKVDRATVNRILALATDLRGEEACGAVPLNGALLAARRHGLVPRLLGLRNSGDAAAGDGHRVVGYGALAFDAASPAARAGDDITPAAAPADAAALGRALVATARQAIAQALGLEPGPTAGAARHPALQAPGATFVTLHDAQGGLRGCVGQLQAWRALAEDVRANALAAAFEDRRFEPLCASEWPGLHVEVSLLAPAEPLDVADEAQALAALRPGVDGVILEWQGHRATLLPQVWEQLPTPALFMAALKRKAHLPPDFWAPDLRLSRYTVRSFADEGSAPAVGRRS